MNLDNTLTKRIMRNPFKEPSHYDKCTCRTINRPTTRATENRLRLHQVSHGTLSGDTVGHRDPGQGIECARVKMVYQRNRDNERDLFSLRHQRGLVHGNVCECTLGRCPAQKNLGQGLLIQSSLLSPLVVLDRIKLRPVRANPAYDQKALAGQLRRMTDFGLADLHQIEGPGHAGGRASVSDDSQHRADQDRSFVGSLLPRRRQICLVVVNPSGSWAARDAGATPFQKDRPRTARAYLTFEIKD